MFSGQATLGEGRPTRREGARLLVARGPVAFGDILLPPNV